jgi:hypothetical protein
MGERTRIGSRSLARWLLPAVAICACLAGTAFVAGGQAPGRSRRPALPAGRAALRGLVPTPIGVGGRFHPPPGSATRAGRPVAGLRCTRVPVRRFGVHVEVFAAHRVLLLPAGIGVAQPWVRSGAEIRGGRCSYPARTVDPTGVVEVAENSRLTLGSLFSLWQKPLGRRRLLGFRGQVQAFVDGRLWVGDPRRIPLRRHAEIVLEIGGFVPPHAHYRFVRSL